MRKKVGKENKVIHRILKVVKNNHYFFITAHLRPDGDTIGSEIALAKWLKKLGKKVTVANVDPVPKIYHFLPGVNLIQKRKKIFNSFEVAFILECSEPERIGGIIDFKKQSGLIINIDHHARSKSYGDINWFDPKASATTEQIYKLIKTSKKNFTRDEAISLYVGLLTDTGKFQQHNTTPKTHQIAAELLKYGIKPEEIHQKIYATKSLSSLRLLGLSLSNLKLTGQGKIAYQEVTRGMHRETHYPEEDEEIINYPLSVPHVEVSILFREMFNKEKNEVKVGFRSRNKIDVHKIAQHFGGGGHFSASGCTLEGNLNKIKKLVINYVKNCVEYKS